MLTKILDIFIFFINSALVFLKYGLIGNRINIDASTMCQLRCPTCWQNKKDLNLCSNRYLNFCDFKNFIDKYHYFKIIELANFGEIFLNPELKDIIKYANSKNVNLSARNGVNFNNVDDETMEYLVKYQFRAITFAIDGASNETYGIYRRGGCFERVIENIKRLNYFKSKYNSKYPKMIWQFIIFGHNEHELPKAKKIAQEIGMKFKPRFNFGSTPYNSFIRDKKFVRSQVGAVSIEEYEKKTGRPYIPACINLWTSPQIDYAGKLLGCCSNNLGIDFGNVFRDGLKRCIKSDRFQYAKKMLTGRVSPRSDIPCFHCRRYRKMKETNSYINPVKIFRKLGISHLLYQTFSKEYNYTGIRERQKAP